MGEDFHSNPGLVNLFGIEFPDLNIKHSQLQNTLSRATAVGLRVHAPLQTYWMQSRIALSSALSGTTYGHRTADQGLMTLIRQDTFCPLISPCCRWLLDCVMATLKTGHLWLSSCVIGGQRNQTKLE
ncbi:uncharacterized protein [Triticum aestivum]|uniref:uncharacterized protein isoform X1 n=1 Tax=Triticum aestivum TaxID=4565 RepID=UPI001D015AF8|nr:uncharacterized protein LOC123074339 isoform X1 [Triticum aestivum]